MINTIKANRTLRTILGKIENIQHSKSIPIFSYHGENWGDKLSLVITSLISEKPTYIRKYQEEINYCVIGSILENSNKNSIIWGSGFMSETTKPKERPNKIYAVRGAHSRQIYLNHNIDCPEIYGDPAILMPLFYKPQKNNNFKNKIGVIPHYIDKKCKSIEEFKKNTDVIIIDIESDTYDFIDKVASCEYILSSSLHGLICAEAYGIPSTRAIFSQNIGGGDFKFTDYRSGIQQDPHSVIDSRTTPIKIEDIIKKSSLYDIKSTQLSLIKSCPFASKASKENLINKIISS